MFDVDGPAGLAVIPGAAAILDTSASFHRQLLDQAARLAAERLADEAVGQGLQVPEGVPLKFAPDQVDHLDVAARRLAQAPHVDLVRALRERAAVEPLGLLTADDLIGRLTDAARGLAEAPLDTLARSGAQQAHGVGRLAAARELPVPAAVYASELLDRNTCGPCSLVDGRSYRSIEAGLGDYATGIYVRCDGGPRCRGTLVFVWAEAPPSVG